MRTDGSGTQATENEDRLYLAKTIRSNAFVLGFILLVVASYGQGWTALPLLVGNALACGLFWGMDIGVRRLFTPERAGSGSDPIRKKQAARSAGAALLWLGLIKYALVGALMWGLTRTWDTPRLMAFAAGFGLLHLVIALRAMGKVLTSGNNAK